MEYTMKTDISSVHFDINPKFRISSIDDIIWESNNPDSMR